MKRLLALTLPLLALSAPAVAQTTLYDGAGGQKVSQYGGWLVFPTAFETFAGGATVLNTTVPDNSTQAGFSRFDQTLNRAQAFSLGFTLKVDSETHDGVNGPNRSGVSVIAITSDLMGIELGFWSDRIWAQSGPGFTKAEEGLFDTTAALANYSLQISGTSYQLLANGTPVVGGALRNYSSSGLIAYNTSNFIFFGDNTTSARGSFRTSRVTLTTAPEPGTLGLLGLGGLLLARRRRK
jgi:PEP-CTERM motif